MKIAGKTLQVDISGQGHCWVNVDPAQSLEMDAQSEIEQEIIDGKVESCDDFVASNGLHYRWS